MCCLALIPTAESANMTHYLAKVACPRYSAIVIEPAGKVVFSLLGALSVSVEGPHVSALSKTAKCSWGLGPSLTLSSSSTVASRHLCVCCWRVGQSGELLWREQGDEYSCFQSGKGPRPWECLREIQPPGDALLIQRMAGMQSRITAWILRIGAL